jgi:hypothetical protein
MTDGEFGGAGGSKTPGRSTGDGGGGKSQRLEGRVSVSRDLSGDSSEKRGGKSGESGKTEKGDGKSSQRQGREGHSKFEGGFSFKKGDSAQPAGEKKTDSGGKPDLLQPLKDEVRKGLKRIDKALEPVGPQLKDGAVASRKMADGAEKIAKETHLKDVAEAVMTVDSAYGEAKAVIGAGKLLKTGVEALAKGAAKAAERNALSRAKSSAYGEIYEKAAKAGREAPARAGDTNVKELLKDRTALNARLKEELKDFKGMQDKGSEPMRAGSRLTFQEHGKADINRKVHGLSGDKAQSMHVAPQSAMRELPNWNKDTSFTVPGAKDIHRTVDAGWKSETRSLAGKGQSTMKVEELKQIVGRSIDKSRLKDGEKMSLKARLDDELRIDYGLKDSDKVRMPYSKSGRAAAPDVSAAEKAQERTIQAAETRLKLGERVKQALEKKPDAKNSRQKRYDEGYAKWQSTQDVP